jgi:hypothetical protein
MAIAVVCLTAGMMSSAGMWTSANGQRVLHGAIDRELGNISKGKC